jgi:hypothetical protein
MFCTGITAVVASTSTRSTRSGQFTARLSACIPPMLPPITP